MFNIRSMSRFATSDRGRRSQANHYAYSTPDDAATVQAAGYFDGAKSMLRKGDLLSCTVQVDATPSKIGLAVLDVPLIGNITVALTAGGGGSALSISGTPAAATVGDSATFTPTISGGTPPYTLSLFSGTLPAGRSISGNAIVGTYTTAGSYSYVLRATDSVGATANLSVSLTVAAGAVGPYLPALATAPIGVFGTSKLISAYSGPALRVVRASDSVEQDIAFSGNNLDTAAATTFQGASTLTVKTWYDQTGLGNHLTQPTANLQPTLWLGEGGPTLTSYSSAKPLLIPTTLSIERTNASVFTVTRTPGLGATNAYWMFGSGANDFGLTTSRTSGQGAQIMQDGSSITAGLPNKATTAVANMSVLAVVSGASGASLHRDDQSNVTSFLQAKTLNAGGQVGSGNSFIGRNDMRGWVVYPAALSDPDVVSVKATLKSVFSAVAPATKSFHFQGDSIVFGTGGSNNRTITAALAERVAPGVLLRNNGIAGQTLAARYQDYTTAGTRSRYVVDGVENVYFANYGHNDIKTLVTDSATATSVVETMKAQVRALCADLRTAGYARIIWQETFADTAAWTADMETARDAWNAWLSTGPLDTAGALCFDAIDNVATDAAFVLSNAETDAGRGMALTSLSSDGVHPNEGTAAARAVHFLATYNNIGQVVSPNPTLTISSAQSQNEGASGAVLYTYTVTRSATTGAVVVPWFFSAGTTSADDFTGGTLPTGGNVSMADGVSTGTFSVSVNGDATVETNESFTVSISVPGGYSAGTSLSATGTIVNDDVAAPTGYLLDGVTSTPAAVYSLRRTRTAYTGPAIKVRRDSDSTTLDIGFTAGGDLDTAALLAFTGTGGSNNGFIDTWYDQGPAALHATQATAASQPKLVALGAVNTRNGKPIIVFANSTSLVSNLSASPSIRSLRFVGDHRTNANSDILRSSANGGWNVRTSAAHALQLLVQAGTIQFTTTALETLNVSSTFSIDWNAGAYSAAIDGGTALTGTAAGVFTAGLTTIIGGASSMNTGLSTLIAFDGAILSSGDSLTIQASQKAYWGTA